MTMMVMIVMVMRSNYSLMLMMMWIRMIRMTTIKWQWWRRGGSYIELPRRFINRRLRFDPEQNPVQKSSPNDTIQTITLQYRKDYYRVQTLRLYIFQYITQFYVQDEYIFEDIRLPTRVICTYLDIYWMCKYKILEIQSTTVREGSTTQREKNAKDKYKISIKCKDNKNKAQHARINK